jgi:MoxR-like ATPase
MTDPNQTLEALVLRLRSQVIAPLAERFVDKKEVVELLAVASVAGENLLLLGPPGTAKSQIVQDFAAQLEGRYFECLLTRFSEPNELFGPVDLIKLKEGVVETRTDGMLPDADFAFLDEVFNGNSAILNSLLNILNERTFRRGRERHRLDLFSVVGASNRLPEDAALRALYDRFLVRIRCDGVADASLPLLFDKGWKIEQARIRGSAGRASPDGRFTVRDLRAICSHVPDVDVDPIRQPYVELVRKIRGAGVPLSDRRVVRLLRLVAVSSLFCGRRQATPADFWVLRYVWDSEAQAGVLDEIVTQTIRAYVEGPGAEEAPGRVHEMAVNRASVSIVELGKRFDELELRLQDASLSRLERLEKKERMVELLRLSSWVIPAKAEDRAALETLKAQIKARVDRLAKELESGATVS